tara:strand:- start:606 stop:932 length:327 start_codon:yes stop_codon:yes gene_type:complete|eukprot:scaffold125925_cov48-Phaeocystis_antarctica.AAC.1
MRVARIVGGAPVTPFEHNWVSLLYSNGARCGASLLEGGWALTAAHCTEGADASTIFIGVHRHARSFSVTDEHECAETIAISEKFEHEAYDSRSITNDIALLRLKRPPT